MTIELWKVAIAALIYSLLNTFVFKPLLMKLFPKYFILQYLGVAVFDLKRIGTLLVKLKKTNMKLYNEILDKAKDLYKFSIDEKELEEKLG